MTHTRRVLSLTIGTLMVASAIPTWYRSSALAAGATQVAPNPDAVCADCHRAIYDRYQRTPMARASGPALSGLLEGGFTHTPSNVDYKVFERDGKVWMSYRREQPPTEELKGERQLRYFIGSGHRGRTYLYEEAGLWFEAPINHYTRQNIWDMAPNYGSSKTMPADLPVDPNCLHCHATGISPSIQGTRNHYSSEPFSQGGIGCSSCHGDPSAHLAKAEDNTILNPDKLSPIKRDSICLQCHLEGNAAIYRAGTSLAAFRPGDDIGEHVTYFVRASGDEGIVRAASQYEALLRSRCKIASGDKLTCTTCHDPHDSPGAAERVAYFRNKCLTCHSGEAIATRHHPEQQDCAACHMPTRSNTDISHEQATDHYIQKKPSLNLPPVSGFDRALDLIPVGKEKAGDRELGLAYAQFAQHGDRVAGEKALKLLQSAESQGASDAELHTQLGLMQQLSGNPQSALREYSAALAKEPNDTVALGNLAVLDASSNHVKEAIQLLERVIQNDPSQAAAGLNLAFIECRIGDSDKALRILTILQRFTPDDPTLRSFVQSGIYAGQRCNLPIAQRDEVRH